MTVEKESIISRIDHVSLAVRDYDKAERFFSVVFGALPGASAADPVMKYVWQLFSLGDMSRFELLRATGPGSFLEGFLAGRPGGVHHITLQTPDIAKAMKHLEQNGIPYFGYNEYRDSYWKEIFIHPRDAFGVLIQISEFEADDWLNDAVKPEGKKRWVIQKADHGIALSMSHPGGGSVKLELSREEVKDLIRDLQTLDREGE